MSVEQAAADGAGRGIRQEVTAEGVKRFHHAFGGSNAIHTQDPPPGQEQAGGVIQHGMRTLFPVIAKALAEGARTLDVSVKFLAPVRAGDVVLSHPEDNTDANKEEKSAIFTIANKNENIVATGAIKYTIK